MSLTDLRELAVSMGMKPFSGSQIARWLYHRRVASIDEMTDLSINARKRLAATHCVGLVPPVGDAVSADGTVKYLFPGAGGRDVEAVFIPDKDRATLCVSSQAGCRMGCRFCLTGRQGFHGNLTAAQIINQVMSVRRSEDLTNIVFMGMGEPLDNLSPVLKAIEVLTADWGFGWSPKRITVSTIGKLDQLRRLIEQTRVHIAVSVHSPVPVQREGLMPVQKAFDIRDVMALLRNYDFAHQRRLSVEYIMWKGVNDALSYADRLASLLKGTAARVNLIRFHAIPDCDLRPCNSDVMEAFRDELNRLGVTATIRASRGEDIMAACGMLAGRQKI